MASNGNARRLPRTPQSLDGRPQRGRDDEQFEIRKIFLAFTDLPRVMGLIWSTSRWMTIIMALVSIISGFLPAVSVWITRGVVDSVIVAAFSPRIHWGRSGSMWWRNWWWVWCRACSAP